MRYLEESRRRADGLVAERQRRIAALSEELVAKSEAVVARLDDAAPVRQGFENLVRALGDAAERLSHERAASEEEFAPPPFPGAGNAPAPPPPAPQDQAPAYSPPPSRPTRRRHSPSHAAAGPAVPAAPGPARVRPAAATAGAPLRAAARAAPGPAGAATASTAGFRSAAARHPAGSDRGARQRDRRLRRLPGLLRSAASGAGALGPRVAAGAAGRAAAPPVTAPGWRELDDAKMVAIQLAATGATRAGVRDHLQRGLGIPDASTILDEVFGVGSRDDTRVPWTTGPR